MSDPSARRPRIPSPDALLPLPEAAVRLVQLVRDWLPCEPPSAIPPAPAVDARLGLSETVGQALGVAGLVGRARAEMGAAWQPWAGRVSGWENELLVLAGLNRLAAALEALFDHLGWAGLWGADGYELASEGVRRRDRPTEWEWTADGVRMRAVGGAPGDGEPVRRLGDKALIVERKSPRPVPVALLDATEQAARLLSQELTPTAALISAEAARAVPPADVLWTAPDSVRRWARVYNVHRNTMTKHLKNQTYRNRRVGRLYEIAVADLPAHEQTKHLSAARRG